MSELHGIYEPGDRVHTVNAMGQVYVWAVATDGLLTLIQQPVGPPTEIPHFPPKEWT